MVGGIGIFLSNVFLLFVCSLNCTCLLYYKSDTVLYKEYLASILSYSFQHNKDTTRHHVSSSFDAIISVDTLFSCRCCPFPVDDNPHKNDNLGLPALAQGWIQGSNE